MFPVNRLNSQDELIQSKHRNPAAISEPLENDWRLAGWTSTIAGDADGIPALPLRAHRRTPAVATARRRVMRSGGLWRPAVAEVRGPPLLSRPDSLALRPPQIR